MVLLIGNYPLDRQQSMQRFTNMMLQGLTAAGVSAEIAAPSPVFGKFFGADSFIGKWLAYLDKFVFFPRELRKRLSRGSAVVHICDHSNAMYQASAGNLPVVVTCHDLIAVRSALGEELHCPVSFTGRLLQRWILRSLRRVDAVVCVSNATRDDAERLVGRDGPSPKLETINNGLNYPYRKLAHEDAVARLNAIPGFGLPFVLHVGSNLPRKNRDAVLRIFARTKDKWNARLVFAGDALDPEQRALSVQLKIADRVVEINDASDQTLQALYSCATTLLYPSLSEGFGWPIIEAQACGCPVVCTEIAPMPETAGDAGLFHKANDEAGFAADILRMNDPAERAIWSEKGLRNAERFSTEKMISRYIDVYRNLGAKL
ncbi:MAG TPA: glycosyltransferase family 1 protein [Chthoniobacterales bacterium]|nr:glycosyltransferase family 1 protein [Chthoniobacterales bacterium]